MSEKKSIIFLLLFILHTAAANTSLWNHVVKMEQVILSVEYNGRHLNVWKESSHGYNRFYVTPLCTLEKASIKCRRDEFYPEHRHILSFNVKMWDLKAAETIKLALAQKSIEAKVTDILPLPMLMVRLGVNNDVTQTISVNKEWRSNQDQPNVITFELYTRHEDFCDKTVKNARADPDAFLASTKMFLEFTMLVGQHATRSLNITGETFVKSKFLSNLDNKHNNKTGIIYLASSDMNKLARDIYRTALVNDEVTSTYVPSEQENQIISELLDVIKGQTVHANDLTTDEWNSVFWDNIFSRPDHQAEYFNEVLKYDEGENHFKYDRTADKAFQEDKFQKYHNEREATDSTSFGFSLEGFFGFDSSDSQTEKTKSDSEKQQNVKKEKSKLSLGVTSTYGDNAKSHEEGTDNLKMISKNTISHDDLQKHLKKDNVNVKWTGSKFTPKDLLLYRLNAKSLKASGEILYNRIVTTKFESTQKIEIRPEPSSLASVSAVYYEELKKEVTSLKEQLNNATSVFQKRFEKLESYQFPDFNFNILHPTTPFEYYIPPGSLNDKKEIVFTGKPKLNGKYFHFSLRRGGDIFFSTRVELPKNGAEAKHVWTHCIRNNCGLEKHVISRYSFREGVTFVYKIEFGLDHYEVYVDGQRQYTDIYHPDIYLKEINKIHIYDDIIIEKVELKTSL